MPQATRPTPPSCGTRLECQPRRWRSGPVQTAEGPLRRSRRLRAKMCIRTLRLSSEALRFSTAATAWLPARCSEGNSHEAAKSILNIDRPTKRRRSYAGHEIPSKRVSELRRIGREGTRSPAPERHGGVDEGGLGPLPPSVELGQRVHRYRVGAPRRMPCRPGASYTFPASVENRQGAPHRLQLRGSAGELLPRSRSLVLRRSLCRRPARAALHELPVPAPGPRHRRPEDLGSRQQREGASGGYRLPARHLPKAPRLAPLSPYLPRPGGAGAGDDLPSMGERHRQLPT